MIKLLGFRRTLILGILLGLNVVFLAVYYLWATPQIGVHEMQLNGLRNEIGTLQTNIQNTKTDLQLLRENLPFYDELLRRGFYQDQDRFTMSRSLDEVKTAARIQGFSFSVGDIREIPNNDTAAAGKRLLHSRVELKGISSLMDVNFFDLLSTIEQDYPVHVRIHSYKIARDPLTEEKLRRLTEGAVSTVNAEIVFDWFSMGGLAQEQGAVPGGPVAPGGI